jgi:RimJ/RimL family protein N-acetyltransferase
MMARADVRAGALQLETARLKLRPLTENDAAFYLRLVNEPSWLRFIGDKGIRTLDDAREAILNGPIAMFARSRIGHFLVESRVDGASLGVCGLIQREGLSDPDIGYAFLPEFWKQGYAYEAAAAVLDYGRTRVGLKRIVAITSPDNWNSIALLEKLGLQFERMLALRDGEDEVKLFARQF